MALLRRLATLATAAEAARRYAKSHPDQTAKLVDQAAKFVDKQTKGKYSGQITGAAQKAKNVAGIRSVPGPGPAGNGHAPGYGVTGPGGHRTQAPESYDDGAGPGRTSGAQGPEAEPYPGTPKR